MKQTFAFELNQPVQLSMSGEKGVIIGRAEYIGGNPPSYRVRYVDAVGRQQTDWFDDTSIEAQPQEGAPT